MRTRLTEAIIERGADNIPMDEMIELVRSEIELTGDLLSDLESVYKYINLHDANDEVVRELLKREGLWGIVNDLGEADSIQAGSARATLKSIISTKLRNTISTIKKLNASGFEVLRQSTVNSLREEKSAQVEEVLS